MKQMVLQISRWINSQFGRPHLTLGEWHFLRNNIKKQHKVLEFGSGNSTLHLQERCKKLVSIEHNRRWYDFVKVKINPQRVDYHHRKIKHYTKNLKNLGSFDVVIIDGRSRLKCAKDILKVLKKDHMVFVHDWYRPQYHKMLKDYTLVHRKHDMVLLIKK